jgi:cysteine desulfurase
VHGPKGIGALIARRRAYRKPPLEALMLGGGQERGLRPGTIPVHLVAGFGAAASAAIEERHAREQANRRFRTQMMEALSPLSPAINGDGDATLTQVANVSFPEIDAEAAILASKDLVAVSSGSACTSGSFERSHVLAAMGLGDERLDAAIRFSWCHLTPEPDWQKFVGRLSLLRQ